LEIKYFSFKNLHFINFYRTFVPVLNMAVITPFIMEKKNIGEKILALCKSRNLSIQDLVDTTGLSEVQIKRVIESETIPSLAPLIKIARALGVRLGTFLDDAEELGPVVHRSGEVQQPASFPVSFRMPILISIFMRWHHAKPTDTWNPSSSIFSLHRHTNPFFLPTKEKNLFLFWKGQQK